MKTFLRNFYFKHIDPERIISRINDGRRDLKCALPNAQPITKEERELILNFWKPYLHGFVAKKAFDIRWFDVYNRTNVFGDKLELYIPDGYYYAIVDRFFNDPLRCKYMDDKNLYDLYFHDVNQAKTICRKEKGCYLDGNYAVISKQKAIDACIEAGEVILKPSVSAWAGSGIMKWVDGQDSVSALEAMLDARGPYVIQELIHQHESLSQFNSSCVNTMRLITLSIGGCKSEVVSAVLIMGGKGAFTNHLHRGGLICGIKSDGSLRPYAFDGNLQQYAQHPNGPVFAECKIPNFHKCVDLVTRLAPRLYGSSRLTAWDVTLDQKGEPLLIEANFEYGGVVQKAAGPIFGERTEEVLNYIAKYRK